MAPPGRRRDSASLPRLLPLLFAILLFLSPSTLAANAVLGLDVGTEYIKAALVKPGIPLEIVLTKDSKRKEASAVAFKPLPQGGDGQEYPERLYGGDAIGLAPRFPTDVYPNLKHLLGVPPPLRAEAIARYRRRYPVLDLHDDAANGTIIFHSKTFPTGHPEGVGSFSVEELLAMELKGIRENAEDMAKSEVRDVVITIPTFYTADERRAVEFAAELAGFKVMSLMSDGLAVGLNYATSRTFAVVNDTVKPEYHLVYDMGAGSTTATLLRMQGKKTKGIGKKTKEVQEVSVISVGWDRLLGGDALNDLIVNDMVTKFVGTSAAKAAGITAEAVRQHGRAMAKLWRESERLRQVLSANTATSGFFEGLLEDVDFRYKLSRSEFEELATTISPRVGQPIESALAIANLAMANLTSVILHGGTVRTPFIQSLLETRVDDPAKLRGNVNADEAAVFGAAFKAAGLSPSFKVKEINANDVAAYNTVVHWTSNGKPRSQQVFLPTSSVGPVKQMPFRFLDDFRFSISQKVSAAASGDAVDRPIVDIVTTNLTSSVGELVSTYNCARENITTLVFLRLDPATGLPEVTKSTVSCESSVVEKKGGVMEGVKGILGFGKKDQKPLDDDDDVEELEPLPEASSETSSETSSKSKSSSSKKSSSTSTSSSKGSKETDKKTEPTKKMQITNIKFDQTRAGLPQPAASELRRIKDGLAAFDKSDQGRRLREELFNGLEAFTYRVRDLLTESGFIKASSETQRSEIEALLGTTSEWLHGEGASAGMEIIKEKLQALKALVDPVTKRKEQSTKRPAALQTLTDVLDAVESRISKVKAQVQSASSSAAAKAASESASTTATSDDSEQSASASPSEPEPLDAEPSATDSVVPEESESGSSESTESSTAEESSSSSTSTTAAPWAKYTPYDPFAFTDADLDRIQSAYDSASEWLLEKLEKQKELRADQDPVLTSDDLEKVTEQLIQVNQEMVIKEKSKSSASSSASAARSRSSSSSKSKASVAASKSKAAAESSASASASGSNTESEAEATSEPSAAAESSAAPPPSSGEEEEKRKHDEL